MDQRRARRSNIGRNDLVPALAQSELNAVVDLNKIAEQ